MADHVAFRTVLVGILLAGLSYPVAGEEAGIGSLPCNARLAAASETQRGHRIFGGDPHTLVLHVIDEAHVPASDLHAAEKETSRIFEAAGIKTVWLNPGKERHEPQPEALHLTVLLLNREMAQRKITEGGLGADMLGRAGHDTARAYLFHDRIAAAAADRSRDFSLVLGRVLAHEVGHMVLPGQSHSETGIMRARLDLSISPQRFAPEQIRLIHETITADLTARR